MKKEQKYSSNPIVDESIRLTKKLGRVNATLYGNWKRQGLTVKAAIQWTAGTCPILDEVRGMGSKGAMYQSPRHLVDNNPYEGEAGEIWSTIANYLNTAHSGYTTWLKKQGLDSSLELLRPKAKIVEVEPEKEIATVAEKEIATVAENSATAAKEEKEEKAEKPSLRKESVQSCKALYEELKNSIPGNVARDWKDKFTQLGELIANL